jgi:DNA-binding MarR family transcriptional regulator
MMEMVSLLDEVRLLEHRLVQVVEALHGTEIPVAGRGVLEHLLRHGPTTVPDLARARFVSRQHIQTRMDLLANQSLVEPIANPAHRRSPQFQLTDGGRRRIKAMHRREADAMRIGFSASALRPDQLNDAAAVLQAVRRALDDVADPG